MGNSTKTLLGDELASDTVNAVGLVLYADKSSFKSLNELLLTGCHLDNLLLCLSGTTLLQCLVGRRSVIHIVGVLIH